MTITEFSDQFDVLYNNITSNQAPGLNEYEKSLFLTKAEKEIVKNYFTANSKGNNLGQGFDDSAKRQADFSILMKTAHCMKKTADTILCHDGHGIEQLFNTTDLTLKDSQDQTVSWSVLTAEEDYQVENDEIDLDGDVYTIVGFPYESGGIIRTAGIKVDPRSNLFSFPNDTFIVINESLKARSKLLQIVPLRYDEYSRLMSKPFKRPLKNQAWRLINSGEVVAQGDDIEATKYVEIIANLEDEDNLSNYSIRYIRTPKPIIVANLDGLTIDGESTQSAVCEIDPILHEDILQRAVELAKIAWTATGQDNAQMVLQAGQRVE